MVMHKVEFGNIEIEHLDDIESAGAGNGIVDKGDRIRISIGGDTRARGKADIYEIKAEDFLRKLEKAGFKKGPVRTWEIDDAILFLATRGIRMTEDRAPREQDPLPLCWLREEQDMDGGTSAWGVWVMKGGQDVKKYRGTKPTDSDESLALYRAAEEYLLGLVGRNECIFDIPRGRAFQDISDACTVVPVEHFLDGKPRVLFQVLVGASVGEALHSARDASFYVAGLRDAGQCGAPEPTPIPIPAAPAEVPE